MADLAGPLTAEAVADAVVVRPGDRLVVRVESNVTQEWAEEFKAKLSGRLPGVEVTVIAVEQLLVYRPGGDDGG